METLERDYTPKGVRFYYVYKALAHPEHNRYVAPVTLEERLMHVKEAERTLGSRVEWLCDTMSNDLSAALGVLEQRVLLVDCDPQANASRGLGSDSAPPLLYDALVGEVRLQDVIRPSGFTGVDLVPSSRDLVGVEVEFVGQEGWQQRLRNLLVDLPPYDTILLDCPPSLGHLTVNALTAADGILVPMQCEYFALEGMAELFSSVRRVQQTLNPRLVVIGILLTMFDERTRLSQQVQEEIRRHFPKEVFETVVPRNVRLAEAPSYGIPALEYDIKSRGAQAYLALAREYLERVA